MKLGVLAIATMSAAAVLIGCGGGAETRTPDQWQQEVGAEIGAKTADLRACYRQAGAAGAKSSVAVSVTATPSSDPTATLSVSRDAADPTAAANGALADCVNKALAGLPLPTPNDSNIGDGAWHVTFDPAQLDPTAPVPPAAPQAAAPPAAMAPMPKS
jgi:hypothetical protein